MSPAPHGVVILAGGDVEGALVQAVDARGSLSVVRRCADLEEVRAAARSGVADLGVVDGSDRDLDVTVLEDLHHAGMLVVVLAELADASRLLAVGADAVAQPGNPDGVVESLLALVRTLDEGPGATAPGPTPPAVLPGLSIPPGEGPPPPDGADGAAPGGGGPDWAGDERHARGGAGAPPARSTRRGRSTAASLTGEAAPGAAASPSPGTVVAVWGTAGAPGRSTLAANLAVALAGSGRVVLVDADTTAPSVAHMLALPVDVSGVAALARLSSRGTLSADDLRRAVVPGPGGISVLTGLSTPQRWRELGAQAIADIVSVAREVADWVLVDVAAPSLDPVESHPRPLASRDQTVAAVLRAADRALLVGRGDAVGLARAILAHAWWEELGASASLQVVVNQVSAATAGRRPVNAVAAALAPSLPGTLIHVVPRDEAVGAAVLAGRTVVDGAPRSEAARAVRSLAEQLVRGRAGGPDRRRRTAR